MKDLYLKYRDFIMEVIHFGMVGVINTLMGGGHGGGGFRGR